VRCEVFGLVAIFGGFVESVQVFSALLLALFMRVCGGASGSGSCRLLNWTGLTHWFCQAALRDLDVALPHPCS